MKIDEKYMRRALELARMGEIGAHPNPMVGAVIVAPDGRIVGEGYHRKCGEAHAEVNAVRAAGSADLTDCTIYVTLEPCAHYGKTPPCALLLIEKRIRHVVIGTIDPFAKVQGRGIAMLREAGARVDILDGGIADECRLLNRRFFTAHTLGRPYVALKWAQTADGFVDRMRTDASVPPLQVSSAASRVAVHRYRSTFDAIAVGSNTLRLDRPALDARLWPCGRNPQRVELHRGELSSLSSRLADMYARGITSILIEGGPTIQRSFLAEGLWDELRVETSALTIGTGVAAPAVPAGALPYPAAIAPNIKNYVNPELLARLSNPRV